MKPSFIVCALLSALIVCSALVSTSVCSAQTSTPSAMNVRLVTDEGAYIPYTNTEGYSCDGGERVIKLFCNPSSDMLCNEISYGVDGEKEGSTSAELSYMGTSLYSEAHKKDMKTFVRYATQLAKQAVGVEIDSQMRQYLLATNQFLPMKPQADLATIERHTLKKLGTGFVKILTRRNDLPGGTAYMIFFTVYPDERWSNR
jgi:hypothetical protein